MAPNSDNTGSSTDPDLRDQYVQPGTAPKSAGGAKGFVNDYLDKTRLHGRKQ
jgi:hypothetical protein